VRYIEKHRERGERGRQRNIYRERKTEKHRERVERGRQRKR